MAGSAVAVRDGKDVVNGVTGEVVGSVQVFEMKDYLATLDDRAIEQQKLLASAYDRACGSLIGPNDVQEEKGRTFKKKSAWRKLARHFGISTQIVLVSRDFVADDFIATVTVKAIGPWGQFAEAVGACATDEESGRRTITMADAVATAETRATNRAISNLIAMGEVSAEEMPKGASGARSDKPAAEKVMPFGKSKGTKLGELDDADLAGALKWCKEGDKAEKFKDLIAALEEVNASRAGGGVGEDAAFPVALEDTDDDLPF